MGRVSRVNGCLYSSHSHPTTIHHRQSSATPYPQLDGVLQRYQNPHEADSLMKVQRELDETKIVLVCAASIVLLWNTQILL